MQQKQICHLCCKFDVLNIWRQRFEAAGHWIQLSRDSGWHKNTQLTQLRSHDLYDLWPLCFYWFCCSLWVQKHNSSVHTVSNKTTKVFPRSLVLERNRCEKQFQLLFVAGNSSDVRNWHIGQVVSLCTKQSSHWQLTSSISDSLQVCTSRYIQITLGTNLMRMLLNSRYSTWYGCLYIWSIHK